MLASLLPYYRQQRLCLGKLSSEFVRLFPELTPDLKNSNEIPEATQQALALLTAKVQHQLETHHNDLQADLLQLLWPNALSPIPAMSIAEFIPEQTLNAPQIILANSPLNISNTDEIWQTYYALTVLPISIDELHYRTDPTNDRSRLSFEINLERIHNFDDRPNTIEFYIDADRDSTFTLYNLIHHRCASIHAEDENNLSTEIKILEPLSWKSKLVTTQDPIQLLLNHPEHYCFFRIDISLIKKYNSTTFRINMEFTEQHRELEALDNTHIKLNCAPIINGSERHCEPVELHNSDDYIHCKLNHYDNDHQQKIISLTRCELHTNEITQTVAPLFMRDYEQENSQALQYHLRYRSSFDIYHQNIPGYETFIRLIDPCNTIDYAKKPTVECVALAVDIKPTLDTNSYLQLDDMNTIERIEIKHKPSTPFLPEYSDARLTAMLLVDRQSYTLAQIQQLIGINSNKDNHFSTLLLNKLGSLEHQPAFLMPKCNNTHSMRLNMYSDTTSPIVTPCHGSDITLTSNTPQAQSTYYYLFARCLFDYYTQTAPLNHPIRLTLFDDQHNELAQWNS